MLEKFVVINHWTCNILHALTDYSKIVEYALEAGANIIVTGAGLPLELPKLVENYPDVAIVPIVSQEEL